MGALIVAAMSRIGVDLGCAGGGDEMSGGGDEGLMRNDMVIDFKAERISIGSRAGCRNYLGWW